MIWSDLEVVATAQLEQPSLCGFAGRLRLIEYLEYLISKVENNGKCVLDSDV